MSARFRDVFSVDEPGLLELRHGAEFFTRITRQLAATVFWEKIFPRRIAGS